MDKQTSTIGWLSVSAVLLLSGILAVSSLQTPNAEAAGMTASAGRYTVIVGQAGAGQDMVYILDSEAHKLLAYRLGPSSQRIELTDRKDMDDEPAADPAQKKNMRP
jgi:hypothetical protein